MSNILLNDTKGNHCTVVSGLPDLPERFYNTYETITQIAESFSSEEWGAFEAWYSHDGLQETLSEWFDYDILARYQTLTQDIDPHIDHGIITRKYLYLWNTGGSDVWTHWWHDNKITQSMRLQPFVWYDMDVGTTHSVSGIEHPRLGVSIICKN